MARILLISPPICNFMGYSVGHTPPLGLMYLAGVLERENHQVKVIDAEALCLSWEELEKKLLEQNPDLIGLGSTSIGLPALFKTADLSKKAVPQAKIIVGGPGPTFETNRVLETNQSVDLVVIKEGEKTIIELIDWLEKGKSLKEIKGIAFRQGEEVIINESQELINDLDSLPFPAYHLLEPAFSHYQGLHGDYPGLKMPNTVIMASRGCPHRCTFCSNNQIRNRWRSPKNIVDEIEFCHKNVGAQSIQLYDDEFIGMNPRQNKWVKEIADEIISRGLNHLGYLAQGRCSQFIELEALQKMKSAGFKWIWWGVESGSQKVLQAIKKDITIDDIRYSFNLAKKAGLKSLMFIMVGLPSETEEDILLTGRLIEDIKPERVRIHVTIPFPGSELWETLDKQGQIEDYNLLNYNTRLKAIHHTNTLSSQRITQLFQMLLFRYESNKWNFVKLFLKSFVSWKDLKKLPQRLKKAFVYLPQWLKIALK